MRPRRTGRPQPGPQATRLRVVCAGAIAIIAALVSDVDPIRVVSLGALTTLLAAILLRGKSPSGLRRVAGTWLVIALTVETSLAVLGPVAMMGVAMALLVSVAPSGWQKVKAPRAPATSDPSHHRSAAWSDRGRLPVPGRR